MNPTVRPLAAPEHARGAAADVAVAENRKPLSNVAEIQSEIGMLSAREMQEIRDWLENILEDQLELREEFKSKIAQSERDMARATKPAVVDDEK
jgi:hypothetical protein